MIFFFERFLHNSLNEKFVSKEHFDLVQYFVSENDNSISWDFYKNNYLLLNKTFGVDKVNSIGTKICRTFFDEKDKQKVKIEFDNLKSYLNSYNILQVNDLFTFYKMDGINQNGKNQLIKTIDENIKFVKENIGIANWLKNL